MDPISPCVCSTNSGIMGVFSGMHTITGYPVVTTEIGQIVPVLFDQQSPTQGNFSFEPGSIELDPYRITPGTLCMKRATTKSIMISVVRLLQLQASTTRL